MILISKKQSRTSIRRVKFITFFIVLFASNIIAMTFVYKANNGNPDILEKEQYDALIPEDAYIYYKNTTGNADGIYVSGNYAYVADFNMGLVIINISDPTNPGPPVFKATIGNAYKVFVSGDYAYVVSANRLGIFNISDPTNPGDPVYVVLNGFALDVYVEGNYAYVADGSWGLAVINITDPTSPGSPIYEDTSGEANGIYVSGNYAYLADALSGLAIINISDPTNPGTAATMDTDGYARGVWVDGNYAYVASETPGLAIINISDPRNPGTPIYWDTSGYAYNVHLDGDYAYVADYTGGLAVFNISDPTNPGTPLYEATMGNAYDVYLSGNYAYVANWDHGLAIIEISKPIDPITLAYEVTSGSANGVQISGDYAYVADGVQGLAVINITDPRNPESPVNMDTDGYAHSVYICGDYAYVADGVQGLAVINISDPLNPGLPVYENTTGDANDVHVVGDYAYVADRSSGLAVINISDPTNPGTPEYEPTNQDAYGVYVSGDYAYVASNVEIAVFNISDPTNPGTPEYGSLSGWAFDVHVDGDYAYVATGLSGLAIINISDPTNPGALTYMDTDGTARKVYVSGDYAYVAVGPDGLAIINISDPTNPGMPVYEDTASNAWDVYVCGDNAYIADIFGLAVIQVRERVDMVDPIITDSPSNFTVEAGYTGQSISWTATDLNNATYTIKLQGTGIVAGPSNWNNDTPITYNIPEGFGTGDYLYTINIIDIDGNFVKDTMNFTVIPDATEPVFNVSPNNRTLEAGYTGESLSWTVSDATNNTYTIELQGSGIIVGPTTWNSGVPTTYNIPDGLAVSDYIYTANFTDMWDNSIVDYVNITVEDTTAPTSDQPENLETHTEEKSKVCWMLTDITGGGQYRVLIFDQYKTVNYTWVDWTNWTSGVSVDVPINRLEKGIFVYSIEFRDNYGNYGIPNDVSITIKKAPSNGSGDDGSDDTFIWIIRSVIGGVISATVGIAIKIAYSRKKESEEFLKKGTNYFKKIPDMENYLQSQLGTKDWSNLKDDWQKYQSRKITQDDFMKAGKKKIGDKFTDCFLE